MHIGILGTGSVGRTLASGFAHLGHHVTIGTRDVAATMEHSEPDAMGGAPYRNWAGEHAAISLATFADAAENAELVVNATSGSASLAALTSAGEANLAGKILLDAANPLDFSHGMPPTLSVCNTDSLAEQIQSAFPHARVVKTLNTITAPLMTHPGREFTLFVSGNDAAAKTTVTALLKNLGHGDVIDLGDITSARGTEMMMPAWLSIWGALNSPMFAVKIVR